MGIVGVLGRDFCGSTMLCRLLACLEGVASGGELHWLVDAAPGRNAYTKSGFKVQPQCTVHGEDCSIYTRQFIRRAWAPAELYQKCIKRSGASWLVVTDKSVRNYSRFVSEPILAIVLYKTPQGQYDSDRRHERRPVENSVMSWAKEYSNILDWVGSSGLVSKKVVAPYDYVARYPEKALAVITKTLGLPPPPGDVLEQFGKPLDIDGFHCVGGNRKAMQRHTITRDVPPEAFALSGTQKAIVQPVWRKLQRLAAF